MFLLSSELMLRDEVGENFTGVWRCASFYNDRQNRIKEECALEVSISGPLKATKDKNLFLFPFTVSAS